MELSVYGKRLLEDVNSVKIRIRILIKNRSRNNHFDEDLEALQNDLYEKRLLYEQFLDDFKEINEIYFRD